MDPEAAIAVIVPPEWAARSFRSCEEGLNMPFLIDVATASPPFVVPQTKAADELKRRMGGQPVVNRMIDAAIARSGIARRSVVLSDAEGSAGTPFYPTAPDDDSPGTAERMRMYKTWSSKLAVAAASEVLLATRTSPAKITRLMTISCTGFSAPNFDHTLITSLGLPPGIKRTHIGFMGCAAALIGFNAAYEALHGKNERDEKVLLVAVELCSLHLQTTPSRDNILANMIFADGCGAAIFGSDIMTSARAELVATRSILFYDSTTSMGWEIGDHGFEMTLSSDLPDMIASKAVPAVKGMLLGMGLQPEDITLWALHPGGRAIIDALQTGLGLTDDETAASRAVLLEHGNMSSASILFVLKELFTRGPLRPGENLVAIAFGPGLTMELALFRGV
jgi:predicted naringenin-chalcone synthase